jgi:hypothetical protein
MSAAMHLRSRTTVRPVAILGALLALLGAAPATDARAGNALSNVLGGATPPNVHTTSTPASALPRPAGTTRTSTALTRTQAPPTISTPHIATTVPQGATTAPATTQPGSTPGATTNPLAPKTPATGTTTPRTTTAPTGVGGAAAKPTAALRPVSRARSSLSPIAIVAAILAVLLIMLCSVWALARWYAYEPLWTLSLRHSLAEAGLRMSSTWEELTDWTRLGR